MKPLVIYHGSGCTDGFGAAFAAWLKFGDEAEYIPMNYGATYNFDPSGVVVNHVGYEINGREVFILDFSFPREVMDDIFVHAKRVVWLDHHKTAFEMWCGGYRRGDRFQAIPLGGEDPLKHYIVLDDNFSGAYLAWEYFHPGTEVPMLIQHIDDRDRWQFKLEGSKELHAALASYQPWTFEMWEAHFLVGNVRFNALKAEGAAILRAHNQHVQAAPNVPSVPEGWLRAIDEALVVTHLGVANAEDTYEQAKAKLDSLIGFHVDVATDPAVNGGWKLMPVEPTKEIYECFTAYDGTMYSNPFNFDNFSVDYAFALEAAPEAKPSRPAGKTCFRRKEE